MKGDQSDETEVCRLDTRARVCALQRVSSNSTILGIASYSGILVQSIPNVVKELCKFPLAYWYAIDAYAFSYGDEVW